MSLIGPFSPLVMPPAKWVALSTLVRLTIWPRGKLAVSRARVATLLSGPDMMTIIVPGVRRVIPLVIRCMTPVPALTRLTWSTLGPCGRFVATIMTLDLSTVLQLDLLRLAARLTIPALKFLIGCDRPTLRVRFLVPFLMTLARIILLNILNLVSSTVAADLQKFVLIIAIPLFTIHFLSCQRFLLNAIELDLCFRYCARLFTDGWRRS